MILALSVLVGSQVFVLAVVLLAFLVPAPKGTGV